MAVWRWFRGLRRRWQVAIGLVAAFVLIGALTPSTAEEPDAAPAGVTASPTQAVRATTTAAATTVSTPAASYPSMFGSKYSVTVAQRIDALVDAKDCAGLQAEFDAAERNNAATRTRTGSGTSDLMGYINDKMRSSGCYG